MCERNPIFCAGQDDGKEVHCGGNETELQTGLVKTERSLKMCVVSFLLGKDWM